MPVYELMRKDQRVTVLAVNKTGGIEKCDYKNINQEIIEEEYMLGKEYYSKILELAKKKKQSN